MGDQRDVTYTAQQRTASVLWELLSVAAEAVGLPPLAWTVPTDGSLVAHVFEGADALRWAHFEAWARFLGAQPIGERVEDGKRVLRARANDVYGCRVLVIAHLEELAQPVDGGGR